MMILSTCLLAATFGLCTVGLYSVRYRDNWPQCLGLVLLAIWSAAEVAAVLQGHAVESRDLALYLGLGAFAAGTALKVVHPHPAQPAAGRQPGGLAAARASQRHNTTT